MKHVGYVPFKGCIAIFSLLTLPIFKNQNLFLIHNDVVFVNLFGI
jgi:hypothetical protein